LLFFVLLRGVVRPGLISLQSLTALGEFGLDGFDGGSPDEGLGFFVPRSEKLGDGGLKVCDAAKGATPYRVVAAILALSDP